MIHIIRNKTNITFQDIAEQVEDMIKSERVENRQTAQGLVSFFVTDINNEVPSNTPKGSGECSNVVCNSGGLLKYQNSFLQKTPVISKQLDSTPNADKLNEFAAQIAAMKAIFLDEIHELKLQLEKFKNSFEGNGGTLSEEKLSDKYLIKTST